MQISYREPHGRATLRITIPQIKSGPVRSACKIIRSFSVIRKISFFFLAPKVELSCCARQRNALPVNFRIAGPRLVHRALFLPSIEFPRPLVAKCRTRNVKISGQFLTAGHICSDNAIAFPRKYNTRILLADTNKVPLHSLPVRIPILSRELTSVTSPSGNVRSRFAKRRRVGGEGGGRKKRNSASTMFHLTRLLPAYFTKFRPEVPFARK